MLATKKFFESFFDPVFYREFAKILLFWITFHLKQKKEKKWNSLWKTDEKKFIFWSKKKWKKNEILMNSLWNSWFLFSFFHFFNFSSSSAKKKIVGSGQEALGKLWAASSGRKLWGRGSEEDSLGNLICKLWEPLGQISFWAGSG